MLDGGRRDGAAIAAFGVPVDPALVVTARGGVRHAYESIVDLLLAPAVAAAETAGADRLTALDVAAETLIRGWQTLPTLRDVDGFGAYLDRHFRDVLAGRHGQAADSGASEVRQLRHVVFRRLRATPQRDRLATIGSRLRPRLGRGGGVRRGSRGRGGTGTARSNTGRRRPGVFVVAAIGVVALGAVGAGAIALRGVGPPRPTPAPLPAAVSSPTVASTRAPTLPPPTAPPRQDVVAYVQGGDVWISPLAGKPRRVIHLPGLAFRNVVWSPDGSRLAVTSDEPAAIVLDLRGGTLRRVAAGNAEAFSPDGTRLLVTAPDAIYDVDSGKGQFLDSGELASLYPGTASWSPNGRWIVAVAERLDLATHDIHRVLLRLNVATHDLVDLSENVYLGFTAWSADSARIAVSSPIECLGQDACGSAVTVLDASGLNATQVYAAREGIGRPAWSPDGARVAFMVGAARAEVAGIVHVVRADGSGLRVLGEGFGDPSWTGAGSGLAWARILAAAGGGLSFGSLFGTSLSDGTSRWLAEGIDLSSNDDPDGAIPLSPFAIVARGEQSDAIPPDGLPVSQGGEVKEVTPLEPVDAPPADPTRQWRGIGTFSDCAPGELDLAARTLTQYEASPGLPSFCRGVEWSPDGTAFLAVSDAGVVRVLVPGSNTHGLSPDLGDVQGISISPRGTYAAVQGCPKSRPSCDGSETAIVRLHGGAITGVVVGGGVTWSADERRLAVYGPDGLSVGAGDGTGLVAAPSIEGMVAWSPDGSRMATIVDGNVVVAAWDGTDSHQLTSFPCGGATRVSWSPRGDRLAVMQGRRSVLVIAADDGAAVARVVFDGRIRSRIVNWAPDGSRIAIVAQFSGSSHVVLMASDGSRAIDLPDADLPLFSPDSRFLASVAGVDSGTLAIAVSNADGSGRWTVPAPNADLPGAWLGATLTP